MIKQEEESKFKPRNQVLVAFQVKVPSKLRRRIRAACKEKGIEQTQLVKAIMKQITAVILQDEEPGLKQFNLLDDE
jgi:hypothetical protein